MLKNISLTQLKIDWWVK